nr:hypothetical protein [Canicola haemoglobinophilus]
MDDRTKLVAEKICEFLAKNNRLDKTIVFCANINHAQRMVQALSELNADMLSKTPNIFAKLPAIKSGKNSDLEEFVMLKMRGIAIQ